MLKASRRVSDRLKQSVAAHPGRMGRLRLFGLLALLVPMFGGFQYLVREAVPRIEIRFVSQDVPVNVPVVVPVERVVERVVYVPVDRVEAGPEIPADFVTTASVTDETQETEMPIAEERMAVE